MYERRVIFGEGVELRSTHGQPTTVTGYASVFYDGSAGTEYRLWQGAKERIAVSAFDRATSERQDVVALFNHNPMVPLGRVSAGSLSLSVNRRGLQYTATPADTTGARDALADISAGHVTGSSFHFNATGVDWSEEDGLDIRTITDLDLYDVGPVVFPAYTAATAEAKSVRSEWQVWKDTPRIGLSIMRGRLLHVRQSLEG